VPSQDPTIKLQNLRFELLQLDPESGNTRSRNFRHLGVIGVGNDFEQVLDTSAPNRRDDPEFRKMRPDRVDGGSLLADQKMAGAMKHQASLLLDRLDRHEPHVRPRHRFANRLCVGRVILLSLDIRFHVGRRYQAHGVPNRLKLARPVMRRRASFNANKARRQLCEKHQDLPTLQLTADDHLPSRINSMHLENRLRDVETNRCNCLHK